MPHGGSWGWGRGRETPGVDTATSLLSRNGVSWGAVLTVDPFGALLTGSYARAVSQKAAWVVSEHRTSTRC